ncbi:hypothetical protein E8E11_004613 [Didymella keratinophila]|nr:hypothetical protein E8E11_004613 [Didymella keratinophila]
MPPKRLWRKKPTAKAKTNSRGIPSTAGNWAPMVEKYYLHKALLMYHSEFFEKALRGTWLEAEEGIVRLTDFETYEFNILVHWLYTQSLPKHDDWNEWDHIIEPPCDEIGQHLNTLVQAYVLGDRLLIPVFRRLVNNVIVDTAPIGNVRIILQFFTDGFCKYWSDEEDDNPGAFKELHPDALVRILRRYSKINQMADFEKDLKCCYYEHASKKEDDLCERQHSFYDESKDSFHEWVSAD